MRNGYVAFTTLLILSTVILLVGSTLALLAIFQAQQSLAQVRGATAHSLVEGCMADALLSSFNSADYSGGTKVVPEGTCTTTVSKAGNNWVLTSTGAISGGYTRRVRVNIVRGSEITVLSWKEIE